MNLKKMAKIFNGRCTSLVTNPLKKFVAIEILEFDLELFIGDLPCKFFLYLSIEPFLYRLDPPGQVLYCLMLKDILDNVLADPSPKSIVFIVYQFDKCLYRLGLTLRQSIKGRFSYLVPLPVKLMLKDQLFLPFIFSIR
jgi:hypothetical protein